MFYSCTTTIQSVSICLSFDFVEGRTQPLSVVHVVILPENETRSIERNFQIVTALQAQFQGSLSAGVYDGRKNFFSPVVLEFETGAQEVC